MTADKALTFDIRLDEPLHDRDIALKSSEIILSMPSEFFPLIVAGDNRRNKRVSKGDKAVLVEFITSGMKHSDGTESGGATIKTSIDPSACVIAMWRHPRTWGLDGIAGCLPADFRSTPQESVRSLADWILGMVSSSLQVVYADVETQEEYHNKLDSKKPPPGSDLSVWIQKAHPRPKGPPHYLTDVVWMSVFGKPYVALIGRRKLMSVPAYSVRELPNGAIAVQVSESPFDYGTKEYADRCEAVRNHIGREYFFDWNDPDREYPQPKLKVEYVKPKELSEKELEQLRVRAGVPRSAETSESEDKVWLEGLHDWVDHNEEHARRFVGIAEDRSGVLDFSIDSLKALDRYMLKRRKKDHEADADLILMASAYLAQVLIRNSTSREKAALRVDAKKSHAVVELPDGIIAVPMARIANLWNLGREEETYLYARSLLGRLTKK